jgi:hypothetical protein
MIATTLAAFILSVRDIVVGPVMAHSCESYNCEAWAWLIVERLVIVKTLGVFGPYIVYHGLE